MEFNPTKSYRKRVTRIVEIPSPYEPMETRGWSLQDRREYAMLYLGQVILFCLWVLLR